MTSDKQLDPLGDFSVPEDADLHVDDAEAAEVEADTEHRSVGPTEEPAHSDDSAAPAR